MTQRAFDASFAITPLAAGERVRAANPPLDPPVAAPPVAGAAGVAPPTTIVLG